ncbi:Golgi transport complex subunit COG5 NDAI_0D01110 [Naumovozyma dairenensis CBS 421]|uniref:Conserved oligomeric Golgi complex subunit 5 n=1 Tax=Naumovozyma dairenensis (strain ATCC 10597 / BCRC 20456 / CBS 421 / NBRC 0211 / NRRL Y-12639) TaxID=1071378 RepID=G0W9G3_NAUDC|nr:hypothetical protein NDAI_0D01110 [Naumovozyma dairenensis CBS 421]CCD24424.1 hypothetical protein NDAI_0D01110 [Naumovozyma dairenensis CBS 421]
MEELEDFEALLEDSFNKRQFANDLLKATNDESSTTTELDIETPIKKLKYDLDEVDARIDDLLRNNSTNIINQLYKGKSSQNIINNELNDSFGYLSMSYKRLQEEVLEPYEKAQKLQSVLSKVHQTSILLRDSLIYIHIINEIENLSAEKSTTNTSSNKLTTAKAIKLATLYSQLQLNLNQNVNLKSLQVIKHLEGTILVKKKELLGFISLEFSKECLNSFKIKKNKDIISQLAYSLYIVSPQDYVSTIQKYILSNVLMDSQTLTKTINSIKNFPMAFEDVVKRSYDIYSLEDALHNIKFEDTNLLTEYTKQRKPKSSTPRELYWNKISSNFKKEFEISYNRGGPVGKSLAKNYDMIVSTIKENMPKSTGNNDYHHNLDTMLKSISIITSESHK